MVLTIYTIYIYIYTIKYLNVYLCIVYFNFLFVWLLDKTVSWYGIVYFSDYNNCCTNYCFIGLNPFWPINVDYW